LRKINRPARRSSSLVRRGPPSHRRELGAIRCLASLPWWGLIDHPPSNSGRSGGGRPTRPINRPTYQPTNQALHLSRGGIPTGREHPRMNQDRSESLGLLSERWRTGHPSSGAFLHPIILMSTNQVSLRSEKFQTCLQRSRISPPARCHHLRPSLRSEKIQACVEHSSSGPYDQTKPSLRRKKIFNMSLKLLTHSHITLERPSSPAAAPPNFSGG